MTLEETPLRVAELLHALDVRKPPAHGEWAAIEHLCHLRDIEAEGYNVRIAQLLRDDDPLLRDLDGDALARERRYREQDAESALRDFTAARARSVELVRDLDDAALAREGTFENVGRVTLAKLIDMMREHDRGHLRDLATIAAVQRFERDRGVFREELEALCRIPGISASSPADVRRSAEALADVMRKHRVDDVRMLEVEGAHPSVYGTVHVDANAPTVLIYGHHDVQPTGDLARWLTPPFEPVEGEGRLFARGACDDKGGVIAHLAAVASYGRALPCNVKFFFEGEEEIGSPNLPRFLEQYRELLRADVAVLADTPNDDTGIPALTRSLRGMSMIDIEVRCLERPLHSGRGAGAAPDAIAILCGIISALVSPASPRFEERLHRDLGLLEGVALVGTREQTWNEPAITVIGFDTPRVDASFNQIAASARARLSVRTVSDGTAEEIVARIHAIETPAIVEARIVKSVASWRTDATGPAFDAARRALTRGYGVETKMIGSGGTIGFVGMFEQAFPGTPLLLMGVEDPPCNAHSENESLSLADWESCARSAIFLYDELTRAL